jgi:DNA modification methylase
MLTIYTGNALGIVPTLEKNSVHCSVTSPPYYSLRKYAGDQQCDWPEIEYAPMPGLPPIKIEAMTCALGHEPTIKAYVGHLVAIYREVRRVLRDDGVAWVVMGDSYAGGGGYYPNAPSNLAGSLQAKGNKPTRERNIKGKRLHPGLQPGDLMLVPHRLALALQADGWVVRNDCVWAKKAPMPESVRGWTWQRHRIKVGTDKGAGKQATNPGSLTAQSGGVDIAQWTDCPGCPKCEPDGLVLRKGSWRFTRAHEYVFQLVKEMKYFANQEAVREPHKWEHVGATRLGERSKNRGSIEKPVQGKGNTTGSFRAFGQGGRNPRTVLSPSPEPSGLKHFAIFPSSLVKPLIEATCPARCCPECGTGWSPVVEKGEPVQQHWAPGTQEKIDKAQGRHGESSVFNTGFLSPNNVLGHRPSCGCGRGLLPDDLEIIASPTGQRKAKDPSLETGRAGFNRPRGPNEGSRLITRYEQRRYAEQLKNSPHRDEMEREAGSAFAHYIRTDRSGARPAPNRLLEKWIGKGWLDCVQVPEGEPLEPVPGTVLDPFVGSGTTLLVADRLGLDGIGIDISQSYAMDIAKPRIEGDAPLLTQVELVTA